MRIRYQSLHGFQQVRISHALGHDYGAWSNGQERDVPDDEMVRWRKSDGGAIVQVKAVDALLSCGPEFVDAATGTNPDWTCAVCHKTTTSDGFLDVTYTDPDPTAPQHIRPYENAAGERLCVADYLAANPRHEQLHINRGLHPDVVAEARATRAAAGVTPGAPPAPVAPAPTAPTPPPPEPTPGVTPSPEA